MKVINADASVSMVGCYVFLIGVVISKRDRFFISSDVKRKFQFEILNNVIEEKICFLQLDLSLED